MVLFRWRVSTPMFIFFSCQWSNEMSSLATLIAGGPPSVPPAPQIWVKRWDWQWVPQQLPDCAVVNVAQAECTFVQTDTVLPALPDWPRWKPNAVAQTHLPIDEYWRLTFLPHYQLCDTCGIDCHCGQKPCGLECQWKQVWTRIETPRAWRWVRTIKPCECEDACPSHH